MNAPDKIYTDNRGIYAEIPVFSQADANVEYLRKDVLLEWAKEQKTLMELGGHVSIDDVIDKLNSI